MSPWREIIIKDIEEIKNLNFAKLNCIQQDLANTFQKEKLSKIEVFMILRGMMEKEMINENKCKKYYNINYGNIVEKNWLPESLQRYMSEDSNE